MSEQVNHPEHYGGKNNPYEAIKVIDNWKSSFCIGNAIKYLARAGRKDPEKIVEDLRKAVWYINHEIEQLEKNPCCEDKGFEVVVQYIPAPNDRWWYKEYMGHTFGVVECTEEEFKNTAYMYDTADRQAKDFIKVTKSKPSILNGRLILKEHILKRPTC